MEKLIDRNQPTKENAAWPYASLLFFGFFGADTPEGSQFSRRTTVAIIFAGIAAVALRGDFTEPIPDLIWVALIPAAIAFIVWATTRYLAKLDELGRMIQLKAYALSYGAAMLFISALIAYSLSVPTEAGGVGPGILATIIAVELLRGLALVVLARRYH